MSLRKSCYYSWVSIPAEPAPVCTFPSFWSSKDSHLACNKILLYFPCKPNTLTSLGVCLVYGLKIWPFICTQLPRSLSLPLPESCQNSKTLRSVFWVQICEHHVLTDLLVSAMWSQSIWFPWDIRVQATVYSLDIHFFCKIKKHPVWDIGLTYLFCLAITKPKHFL